MLEALARTGAAAPEYLAAVTGLPRGRVEAILALLEASGVVERAGSAAAACPCSRCPLARVCGVPRGGARVRLYRVRRGALEACKRQQPVGEHPQAGGEAQG